ncbi:MAG: hypothetical protein IJZ70_07910 [Bacteroidales bacterium]|nr:hypothetical protein [Bacteroidales bacterium]
MIGVIFFVLTGKMTDVKYAVEDDIWNHVCVENTCSCYGKYINTVAIVNLFSGGIKLPGSLKNQKNNILPCTRRCYHSLLAAISSGKNFAHPISDLMGTVRQLIVLEKLQL